MTRALAGVSLLFLLAASALAQEASPTPASEDRWGLARLAPESRAEVERVRRDATVQCELHARRVEASEAVYRRLLEELPLASRWLKTLELGDYQIEDLPKGRFRIDDTAGAKAIGERALSEAGRLVVIAPGTLEVPILPKIRGTGVILIRFPPAKAIEGKPAALACSAEVAFRVEGRVLHGLGRALRRVLRRVVLRKLEDLVKAATALAEAISRDPAACYLRLKEGGAKAKDLEAFRERFLVF